MNILHMKTKTPGSSIITIYATFLLFNFTDILNSMHLFYKKEKSDKSCSLIEDRLLHSDDPWLIRSTMTPISIISDLFFEQKIYNTILFYLL